MTIRELYYIGFYISTASVFIPITLYFINIRAYPRHLHFIGLVVCASALSDLTSIYLLDIAGFKSIAIVHNTYAIVQFCLLSFFYYEVLLKRDNRIYINTILVHALVSGLLFYVFARHPYFISKDILAYHSLGVMLQCLAFIVYATAFYVVNFSVSARSSLGSTATLWINGGALFYFFIAIWAFMLRDQSISNLSLDAVRVVWIIHNLANTVKNLLFAKGLYEARKSCKLSPATLNVKATQRVFS